MSELRDLYQEVILDHNKRPRNFGRLEDATHQANGHNPLCGDRLSLTLRLEDGRIAAIRFEGSGCAISKASASLMTDAVKGRSIEEADLLFADVHAMVTGDAAHEIDPERLGKLAVLGGVAEFPARVKCASLAWHTLEAALHHAGAEISTESETK